ncbi:MAG: hypothetical protein NVSMB32_08700 [Actinomycetota bacterium]
MFAIAEDEEVVRAQLDLEEGHLVVSTHSAARMDRVLGVLGEAVPPLHLVSDDRIPLGPGEMPTLRRMPAGAELDAGAMEQVARQVQEASEQRWVEESVPALGGLTPREAAADPTRRENVERLIASFPDPASLPPGTMAMRPARLRQLLGLAEQRPGGPSQGE